MSTTAPPTDRDWSLAPVYCSRDLAAAETDAYARGRTDGYLDGYRDGATGAAVEAAAQAAAFAALVARTFRGSLPFAELQARRDGHDSRAACRAREVHHELHALVTADARADRRAA